MNDKFQVWDNRGKTLDRYTIFIKGQPREKNGFYPCIGASEHGEDFYQHCQGEKGSHLGKLIDFDSLTMDLQKKLLAELDD